MPQTSTDVTIQVLESLKTFIPYTVVFGIFWKMIDAILKYASDGRDARTRSLIDEATSPLSKDIKSLTESIYELKKAINDRK